MNEIGKNIFCPIDLHQNKMMVGIATDRGQPRFREYDTDWKGGVPRLVARLHQLRERNPGSEVWVAYEASGCGFGLADLMEEQGFRVAVLAPTNLPVTPRSRTNKTDKKDAIRILEVLRGHVLAGNRLPEVWIPPKELRDDREVVRRRLAAAEQLADVKNKIHGLLRRYGIARPASMASNWTKKHVRWLHSVVTELEWGAGRTLASLLRELEFHRGECAAMDREMNCLAASDRYRARVEALTAFKGVAPLTAMVFLTELGDLERFPNRRAFGNYLGLTPRSWESGEQTDRKGRISKQGPSRVRKVLNQAAWSLVRWDPDWKYRYAALMESAKRKKKAKGKRKAIVAVMRLLGISLWRAAREAGPAESFAAA
jgi:transposase